jgi:hypothetical protein
MLDDSDISGRSVGRLKDVGLLGQIIDESGLARSFRTDHKNFNFG